MSPGSAPYTPIKRPLANLVIPLHRSHRVSETSLHTLCWFPRSSLAGYKMISGILLPKVSIQLFCPSAYLSALNRHTPHRRPRLKRLRIVVLRLLCVMYGVAFLHKPNYVVPSLPIKRRTGKRELGSSGPFASILRLTFLGGRRSASVAARREARQGGSPLTLSNALRSGLPTQSIAHRRNASPSPSAQPPSRRRMTRSPFSMPDPGSAGNRRTSQGGGAPSTPSQPLWCRARDARAMGEQRRLQLKDYEGTGSPSIALPETRNGAPLTRSPAD
ncbi:hypothetical protein BD311DRAFT_328601 [Dichomitus squalens]|uniref:Uncharacterized protein n=1 Tax=Dichomitus squalens TaxID=114155 RepID=A0A4Q9MLB1_9APHY|nr:hypothetical protein BD311DRAFT_328601 [Dichomitus squalens]